MGKRAMQALRRMRTQAKQVTGDAIAILIIVGVHAVFGVRTHAGFGFLRDAGTAPACVLLTYREGVACL